jgi:hypothetical protein
VRVTTVYATVLCFTQYATVAEANNIVTLKLKFNFKKAMENMSIADAYSKFLKSSEYSSRFYSLKSS